MLLAGLIGAFLTLTGLHAADHTRSMLAAARDIAPGTVIDAHVLRAARVHVDRDTLATLIDADQLDAVLGRVAVVEIPAGSLLTRGAIRAASDGDAPRAMSFPIPRSRAVGGALRTGDRVDVLAVQRDSGRSSYVAADLTVLDFTSSSRGPLEASDDASVTVAVDSAAAARIASALETGSVTLVRSTGAAPLDPERTQS